MPALSRNEIVGAILDAVEMSGTQAQSSGAAPKRIRNPIAGKPTGPDLVGEPRGRRRIGAPDLSRTGFTTEG